MFRFKVTIQAADYTGTAEVYMFATSYNDVEVFFRILNPFMVVVITQVSDTFIGM